MAKVLIALSGGVDSAVAADLLLKAGHQVTAVTLDLCADQQSLTKAKQLAKNLGLKHIILDWQEIFQRKVVETFKTAYFEGLTPNPCVICNQQIKFGELLTYALSNNFDYLATGHYVRKLYYKGEYCLAKADTQRRDQSYYLYQLSSSQLEHILFPLSEFDNKQEVLDLYQQLNLSSLTAESRGICFTKGLYYADWLAEQKQSLTSGDVYDNQGNYRGRHQGFFRYTIGQKRLENIKMSNDECVLAVDAKQNRVIVGKEDLVYSKRIKLDQVYCHSELEIGASLDFKIFNWGLSLRGELIAIGSEVEIEFSEPVRAVALGQYAVGYRQGLLLLGGRIIAKD